MNPQYERKAEDVRQYAIEIADEMILDVLLQASTECSSIEAACADLENVADSNTIREYLNQAIEVKTLRKSEKQINAALASSA